MDGLLILMGVVCVGAAVLLPVIFAAVAMSRTGPNGPLAKRIQMLEQEIADLYRRLRAADLAGRPADDALRPGPDPAATAAAAVVPPSSPEPATAAAPPPEPGPTPADLPAPLPPWPSPPSPPLPPLPPLRAAPRIEWERWIGVRGAAVLGGVVLALAGLLFFKYSIEHGLISPLMRVVSGTLAGLACLFGSEETRRRGYPAAADGLGGAGVVILYAAFWAAKVLYGLIGIEIAFVLMTLVTAACCLLAVKNASLFVALLGLAGGFLTPLLLASDADRPIGLFGYVLLLDVGFLLVAHRRRWAIVGALSLAGTVLLQALWVAERMGPERLALGLGILGLFALVFAVAGRLAPAEGRPLWRLTQAAAVLVPQAFAMYFAASTRFGEHLYPVALLLVLLSAAAGWIARQQGRAWIGLSAASGALGVVTMWLVSRRLDTPLAWETAAVAVVLALVFHGWVEVERRGPREEAATHDSAPSGILAALGMMALLLLAALDAAKSSPWPFVAGWVALGALLVRQAALTGREALGPIAALAAAAGLGLELIVHGRSEVFGAWGAYLAALVAAAILAQLVGPLRSNAAARRIADLGAVLFAAPLLACMAAVPFLGAMPPVLLLGATLALGLLATMAATRARSGWGVFAAVLLTAIVQTRWTFGSLDVELEPAAALTAFALQIGAVAVFTGWPIVAAPPFREQRPAWVAAALAGPFWFVALRYLYELRFGAGTIGLLPIALGALSLFAADRARRVWAPAEPVRKSTLVWFLAVSLGFVSAAIPLQLRNEWVTIGWALEALAVTLLWRRLDHAGLKYFGLSLVGATAIRLVFNEAVLGYYPRPSVRIVNWLLYTYGVPAAALLGASWALREDEVGRARGWESWLYARKQPWGAVGAGLAAVLVIFVWLNLAVIDWFATGQYLSVSLERLPARDLAMSIGWAAYALILLAIGMVRGRGGLRWVSLAFLVLTIGKVFLYDLGELRDLYRVASLVGLAVSLLIVSLAYQRFVFRRTTPEGT